MLGIGFAIHSVGAFLQIWLVRAGDITAENSRTCLTRGNAPSYFTHTVSDTYLTGAATVEGARTGQGIAGQDGLEVMPPEEHAAAAAPIDLKGSSER